MKDDSNPFPEDEPVEMPIDGILDLHTFHPRDIKPLLYDYFDACREKGILRVRVVHGKGTGTLRQTVHAQLRKMPGIAGFRLGDEASGSWGATWVDLKK